MPLHRRLPKRGFKNAFKVEAVLISLEMLDSFGQGATVDQQWVWPLRCLATMMSASPERSSGL